MHGRMAKMGPLGCAAMVFGYAVLGLILMAGFAFGFGALVMLLWNALLPDILGVTTITYMQGVGLFVLAHLLFKGSHGHHHHPRGGGGGPRAGIKARWHRRGRCGGGDGGYAVHAARECGHGHGHGDVVRSGDVDVVGLDAETIRKLKRLLAEVEYAERERERDHHDDVV
ncbi:MAG: hypothetical protein AB7K09_10550 [Planctomycetota bacterium]